MDKYIKLEDAIRVIDDHFDSIPMEQTIEILQARRAIRNLPTIEVVDDAISREQFRGRMYHRCFEVDNDPNMQKWDSGCWLRWKLFEEELEKAPSAIRLEKDHE